MKFYMRALLTSLQFLGLFGFGYILSIIFNITLFEGVVCILSIEFVLFRVEYISQSVRRTRVVGEMISRATERTLGDVSKSEKNPE